VRQDTEMLGPLGCPSAELTRIAVVEARPVGRAVIGFDLVFTPMKSARTNHTVRTTLCIPQSL
jgi:hypothetical protein